MKMFVISKLLAFHGAVCNVISCALQGMSQLVLGRVVRRHSPLTGSEGGGWDCAKRLHGFIKAACGRGWGWGGCEMC